MTAGVEGLAGELEGSAYQPLHFLARGGMGEVVVAEHRELGRLVVMKLLRSNLQGDEQLADRLRVEARLLAQLRHPNLVEVLDFGRTRGGRPYLVTELLQGKPLHEYLDAHGGHLTVEESLRFALHALAGLDVVHARGFVHRDIKPANLFVVATGQEPMLKILDFGIAKALSEKDRQALGVVAPTSTGVVMGTPSAIAPEQAAARPVDARTDLYSLGVVLFRMVTGKAPFAGSAQELLLAHLTLAPPVPSALAPGPVPETVDHLILRALAKKPEDRFQTAAAMQAAIRAILDGRAGAAAGPDAASASWVAPGRTSGSGFSPVAPPATQAAASGVSGAPAAPASPTPAAPPASPAGAGGRHEESGTRFSTPAVEDTTRRMDRQRLPADRRPTVRMADAPPAVSPRPAPVRSTAPSVDAGRAAAASNALRAPDRVQAPAAPWRAWSPVLVAVGFVAVLLFTVWLVVGTPG